MDTFLAILGAFFALAMMILVTAEIPSVPNADEAMQLLESN